MLHRVVTTANATFTGSTTFASILHAAAGRAWLKTAPNVTTYNTSARTRKNASVATGRRQSNYRNEPQPPHRHDNAGSSVKPSQKSGAQLLREQAPAPSTVQFELNQDEDNGSQTPLNVSPTAPDLPSLVSPPIPTPRIPSKRLSDPYFHPDRVQDSDFLSSACARDDHTQFPDDWSPELATECTSVGADSPLRAELLVQQLPLAKSKNSLYLNLLHLAFQIRPTPSLPQLLDYHEKHLGLRTARSYNLLITLAIRHSAYGTAEWLFAAMRSETIHFNFETYKLRARYLARLGLWDDVVRELNLAPTDPSRSQRKVDIPVPIWVELLQARTDGVPGHKTLRRSGHIEDTSSGITTEAAQRLATSFESRFAFLMRNTPDSTTQNLSSNTPRVVASLVTALLRCRHYHLALSLAHSYLNGLPTRLSETVAKQHLAVIHPIVAFYSTQKGLRNFFESRKTLRSLLRSHRSLRPTSTTLLLLLRSLTDVKRCGTVAKGCIDDFKKTWGDDVVDRRVMLRLASFAVKEGRIDLVDDVSSSERAVRWQHKMWQLKASTIGDTAIPPQDLLRAQSKKFLAKNGREQRKWYLLEGRLRRKKRGEGIKSSRGELTASTEP